MFFVRILSAVANLQYNWNGLNKNNTKTKAIGGKTNENRNQGSPLNPFWMEILEVASTKKIYKMIARPIKTIRRSLIIPHLMYFLINKKVG